MNLVVFYLWHTNVTEDTYKSNEIIYMVKKMSRHQNIESVENTILQARQHLAECPAVEVLRIPWVKLRKVTLCCSARLHNSGTDRALRYLLRGASYKEWSKLKREIYVIGSKARRAEPSNPLVTRHRVTLFGLCPTGLCYCFGSVFDHCASIISFWNGNVCCTSSHVGSM